MDTVLVTGSNRGLGYEFVKQYSESGCNVLACCRNMDKARDLKILSENSTNIEVYQLDVGNYKTIKRITK